MRTTETKLTTIPLRDIEWTISTHEKQGWKWTSMNPVGSSFSELKFERKLIIGYKCEVDEELEDLDIDDYIHDKDMKEKLVFIDNNYLYFHFHEPMSIESALEYSKVDKENLII